MDKIKIDIKWDLVEFWRGEYAKRYYFLENADSYDEVCGRIDAFQALARFICREAYGEQVGEDDVRMCELDLLKLVEIEKELSSLPTVPIQSDLSLPADRIDSDKLLKWVYDESVKAGYVLSDLLIQNKEWLWKSSPFLVGNCWVDVFEGLKAAFAEDSDWDIDETVLEMGIDLRLPPRFFGPNASPAHRLRIYEQEKYGALYDLVGKTDRTVDSMFGIDGLYAEDFNLKLTLREFEFRVAKQRYLYLLKLRWRTVQSVKKIVERTKSMASILSYFDLKGYEEWQESKEDFTLFDKMGMRTVLDHYDSRSSSIAGVAFMKSDQNNISSLMAEYRRISKQMNPLVKVLKKFIQTVGSQASIKYEKPRACGLFLWDSVHIDKKPAEEAMSDFRTFSGVDEDEYDDAALYRLLRIADRCINEKLFLKMTES
nr:hypothetical protein [uncultured Pseudodesulfovibrio sp.]